MAEQRCWKFSCRARGRKAALSVRLPHLHDLALGGVLHGHQGAVALLGVVLLQARDAKGQSAARSGTSDSSNSDSAISGSGAHAQHTRRKEG